MKNVTLVAWLLQVQHYQPWLQLDANKKVERLQAEGLTHLRIPYPEVQPVGPDTGRCALSYLYVR
jgi:hypothetical protein